MTSNFSTPDLKKINKAPSVGVIVICSDHRLLWRDSDKDVDQKSTLPESIVHKIIIIMPNFSPLASMMWEEEELTDGRTDKGRHAISLTSPLILLGRGNIQNFIWNILIKESYPLFQKKISQLLKEV